MGSEKRCGCRQSMGSTFLCPFHEEMLDRNWNLVEKDRHFRNAVEEVNKKLRGVL